MKSISEPKLTHARTQPGCLWPAAALNLLLVFVLSSAAGAQQAGHHRGGNPMRSAGMSMREGSSMPDTGMPESASTAAPAGIRVPVLPGPPMTREDLEKEAIRRNPTLAMATAMIEAAEGRRLQAGLYPNPSFGYNSESATPATRGGEQGFIIQQTIVTANKLGLNRDIATSQKHQSEAEAETQRYRVMNAVDVAYYDALAARRTVEVRAELARLAEQAVDITYRLKNVGQSDAPDLLQAQAESSVQQIALAESIHDERRVWRQLAAVVGDPDLGPHRLAGDFDNPPRLDPETTLASILESSPEVRTAELGVERAKAALARARVEPIPDINFIGGMRVNFERPEPGASIIGPAALAEITATVPIFDRNQGNIAAARAEINHAHNELARVKLELRDRFALVYASYETAMEAVENYRTAIIPEAREAYRLYFHRFQQMAAAYPQVLIAQRTMSQAEESYVVSLRAAWEAVVQLRGMLVTGGLNAPQVPASGEIPAAAPPSATIITRTSPGG